MIFAEKRHEGLEQGYWTTRYLVYNGDDLIGSYGVHYTERGPYGASRDYHRVVTPEQAAAFAKWEAIEGDDKYDFDSPDYLPYSGCFNECCYHDDKLCICDGSSLVEIIDGDDQRAFEIAAMMAEVTR